VPLGPIHTRFMHLAVHLLFCGRLADTVAVLVSHSPTGIRIRLLLALCSLATSTKLRWRHHTLVRLWQLEQYHSDSEVRRVAELLHDRFLHRWTPITITMAAWSAQGGYWPPPCVVAACQTADSSTPSHPQSLTSKQSAAASISSSGVRRVLNSPPCSTCSIAVPGRALTLAEWMAFVRSPLYHVRDRFAERSDETRLALLQSSPLYQAWQTSIALHGSGTPHFRDCVITCPACRRVFRQLHWEWLAVCYNSTDGSEESRMQAAMALLLGHQVRVDFLQ